MLAIFPQRLRIFKYNFTRLYCVHIYAKLQNFIQLSLTLTKLCHIERDHLVNFYISLEKCEKCDISAAIRPSATKFNLVTQNVSVKWMAVKNFNFKIPRWRTAAMLKIDSAWVMWVIHRVEACGIGLLRRGLNFSTAWCTTWLISVETDWKHVLTQKVVTLNTCCDIACLKFQLPHITTGSFQSHWWQPTTGSYQSPQRLKECNKPSVRWKSFAVHKLVWWYFQVGWDYRLFSCEIM